MGQPRIIEVNYQEFLSTLQRATIAKKKVDVADKELWSKFVREHKIPEAGMGVKAQAGSMSGKKTKAVIIDGYGKADGYYLYSPDDLFCLWYDLGRE